MRYYELDFCGLKRQLPIVSLGPKLKIASFNLLGDGELVEAVSKDIEEIARSIDFDIFVGPEVRVVPLLQALSTRMNKPRYVVLRKQIMGYMVKPITGRTKPTIVLNGSDAQILKGKNVLVVDDVISTGRTLNVIKELMVLVGAKVVGAVAVLKQGDSKIKIDLPLQHLGSLPLFSK
jgi:adenine phosphoribosyltransferase